MTEKPIAAGCFSSSSLSFLFLTLGVQRYHQHLKNSLFFYRYCDYEKQRRYEQL